MTLLNPWMLLGAAAIAVPIALHFLNRTQVRVVPWGAMRFLAAAVKRNERHLRFSDLLLLLLRCLLLLLLALAFARPVWEAAAPPAAEGPLRAAFVVDASGSLLQSDGVQTRWDLAVRAVDAALAELPDGSSAALVLAADDARVLVAEPTADFGVLRRTLARERPSHRGGDLLPALQRALTLLDGGQGRREVVVVTDGQAAAWRQLDAVERLFADGASGARLRVVTVGGPPEANVALVSLTPESPFAVAGRRLRVRAEVANFGPAPVASVRVQAGLDGEAPTAEAIVPSIAPGATARVDLSLRPDRDGARVVTAFLEPDRLAWDDARAAGVRVERRFDVLVVEGAPPRAGAPRDGFFAAAALVPVPPAEHEAHPVRVTVVDVPGLARLQLDDFRAVFLCNVPRLDAATVAALPAYLARGGGLAVFPGPATDPRFHNELAARGLLPALLGDTPARTERPRRLQGRDFQHPLVAPWNDPAFGRFDTVRVDEAWPLSAAVTGGEAPLAGEPRVVLAFEDGAPFAFERIYGSGRVFLFAGPAHTVWGDLPLRASFVPLVARILDALAAGQGTALTVPVGRRFVLPVGLEQVQKPVFVLRPGEDGDPRPAGRVETSQRGALVEVRDIQFAGTYTVRVGEDGAPLLFAAQAPAAESDLRPLPAPELERLARLAPGAAPRGPTALAGSGGASWLSRDLHLWAPLVAVVLLLAAAEAFLARYCTRPR